MAKGSSHAFAVLKSNQLVNWAKTPPARSLDVYCWASRCRGHRFRATPPACASPSPPAASPSGWRSPRHSPASARHGFQDGLVGYVKKLAHAAVRVRMGATHEAAANHSDVDRLCHDRHLREGDPPFLSRRDPAIPSISLRPCRRIGVPCRRDKSSPATSPPRRQARSRDRWSKRETGNRIAALAESGGRSRVAPDRSGGGQLGMPRERFSVFKLQAIWYTPDLP
jgi:hypothetical protein